MDNLITVSGVKGYIDESGTAWLNMEAVSRGLGFVQTKDGKEYVRWDRVAGYLTDMGFPHLVGKEFIPENVFYRLSMKGETESAKAFQVLVADEILPSIRKTGSYSTKQIPTTDAQQLRAEAMHLNAKTRQAKMLKDVAIEFQSKLSNQSVQLLISGITEILTGQKLLPMSVVEKTYTATEIGEELGVSSNKIGKVANANNLKTDVFGITVLDKSPHSSKQVPSFRYNERGRERLKELIAGA